MGRSLGSDPVWLWLWLAAAALIQPLARELAYVTGAALKRKKEKKVEITQALDRGLERRKKEEIVALPALPVLSC